MIDTQQKTRHWPIVVVILATLVAYLPVCGHEFTYWDDNHTVFENPHLNPPTLNTIRYYFTHVAYGLYVPITYTVWAGVALVARVAPDERGISLNPWMFHSTNVVVHTLSALFVFLLLRRLVRKDWPACCGALLYALHPVQVEPVAWISGLKDVLAGCFAIIALWRYVVGAQRDRADRSDLVPDPLGTIAFVLAMLAKPSAVTVPAIALVIDWLILQRPLSRAIRSCAVWFMLAIPILIVGRIAQDITGIPRAPIWARPLIATDSLAFYLYRLIWPLRVAVDFGRKPSVVLEHGWLYYTWIAPAIVAIALFSIRKRFRWAIAAGAIFVIALLPILGLSTFQYQFNSTVADHYMYLAMLGPAVALAFLTRSAYSRAIHACAIVAIVLLAVRTITLAPIWSDDISLFENNLKVNPRSVIALNNLGNWYTIRGEYDTAMSYFNRAMAISSEYPTPYENAGRVLAFQGDVEGSIAASEKSIEIRAKLPLTLYPNYMEDHNYVGQVLLQRGEYDRAIVHFQALLKLKPNHADAKKFLAIALEKKHAKAATSQTTH